MIDLATHYAGVLPTDDTAAPPATVAPLPLRSFPELYHDATLTAPIRWLVRDLIPTGRLVLVYAAPKTGKTTYCLHLAVAVAAGRPFCGEPLDAAPVLVLECEMAEQDTRRWLVSAGATPETVGERLVTYTGPAPSFAQVLEALERTGAQLVIIDSLTKYAGWEDENNAAEVERVLEPLRRLAHERGVTILVIDHDRKSDGENGRNIRGSGHKLAVVDVALEVRRHPSIATSRELRVTGRYGDARRLVTLTPDGFTAVDGAAAAPDAEWWIIRSCERTAWKLGELVGLDPKQRQRQTLVPVVNRLVQEGHLERRGGGTRSDPYKFKATAPGLAAARAAEPDAQP
jgi:hypothetical protein